MSSEMVTQVKGAIPCGSGIGRSRKPSSFSVPPSAMRRTSSASCKPSVMNTTGCLRGSRPLRTCKLAWLLLRHCACPRANYLLRALPPALTAAYASTHDETVGCCLATLLGLADGPLPAMPARAARLPLRFGGPGLRGAVADRHAAYWASWIDTLPVIHTRAPGIAARLLALLRDPSAGHLPSLAAVVQAAAYLHTQGFEAPAWGEAFVDHAVPKTSRRTGS